MATVDNVLELIGRDDFGYRLPPGEFGALLTRLEPLVRHSVQMAFQGRSTSPGRPPDWLMNASHFRFVSHESGPGEATWVHFEAEPLGDAAPELYRQGELWGTRPSQQDSPFDVVGDILGAIANRDRDSDLFDPPLLRQVVRWRPLMAGPFRAVRFHGNRATSGSLPSLSDESVAAARSLQESAPKARRVRVVGRLDMVRASTHSFAIRLDDGQEVRGVATFADVREMANLIDRQVLVVGDAVYRPSGRVLRIDADMISAANERERDIWSELPAVAPVDQFQAGLHRRQTTQSGVSAVVGTWPGDETDAEIEEELELIS